MGRMNQQEIDLQARIGELERLVGELAAKVNPLYAGGMDRYIHSGYLQWDGIGMRFSDSGIQIKTDGTAPTGLYFVNNLVDNPVNETSRVDLFGGSAGTAEVAGLHAIMSDNFGELYTQAGAATASAELNYFLVTSASRPRAKLYPLTADIGKLEMQDAVLRFAGLASDPGTLEDGLLWYNTTTDKLYARINGATVTLGGGSMPMPPVVSTASWHCIGVQLTANAIGAVGSATWPTANTAIYIPLLVTEDITVKKLWWQNGIAVSGNVNMSLYDAAFAQVSGTETGSTAQAGTSVIQEVDIADTALTAGLYYMALVMDNTTGTTLRFPVTVEYAKSMGLASQASVFDLPATATLADPPTYAPLCGISTRTQVA